MRASLPLIPVLAVVLCLAHAEPIQGVRPPAGRWSKHRPSHTEIRITEEQQELIDRLQSIGYLSGLRLPPVGKNVVLHSRDRAHQGLNLYTSGHSPEAVLMDMDGRVLHRWHHEFQGTWPDYPLKGNKVSTRYWRRVHLYPNSDILAIHEGLGILKLDRESNLIWARTYRAHHDLDVMSDGEIYVLTREARIVPRVSRQAPILEDFVSILDADGNEKERVSLLECFENSSAEHSWIEAARDFWMKEQTRQLAGNPGDIFHTNSIEVLDGRFADRHPAFRKGNLLISMCHLDMIAVVDLKQKKVVWSLGNGFSLQHDPRVVPGGRLMVFDNNWRPQRSRVVVLDPVSGNPLWNYGMVDDQRFWSRTCGAAQNLPNGNVLITESDNGRAFEVTADGRVVWEFLNPHRAGENDEYIATLFEMMRLPADFLLDGAEDVAGTRSPAGLR